MFIIVSLLGALAEALTISFLVPIIDTLSGNKSFADMPILKYSSMLFDGFNRNEKLQYASLGLLIVFLLRGILQFLAQYFTSIIPLLLEKRLSIQSYEALLSAQLGFINKSDAGVVQSQINNLPQRVSTVLFDFGTALWTLLILAVYVAFMIAVSWEITIVTLAFVAILSLILKVLTSKASDQYGRQLTVAQEGKNLHTFETLFGMSLVRLVAAEKLMIGKFRKLYDSQVEAQRKQYFIISIPAPMFSAATGVFICVMLLFVARLNDTEMETWLSQIFLFFYLMSRLLAPISTLNIIRSRTVANLNALDLSEQFILDARNAVQKNGTSDFQKIKSEISMENVYFSYNNGAEHVLHNLSFSIKRGEMVAVVGPSGAGKTTVVGLLSRLYDPESGRILIDSTDLRELDVAQWRKRISVVSQDIVIFNDTVANNISFGTPETDKDTLVNAAIKASADAFIRDLPQGYDTLLGDRGLRLSGGQKQRIAIARAILTNPDFLILDEATSSLDSVTEKAIQKAIEELSKDRTVLIIAHRLSTIQKADKILVMEGGRLIEQGKHNELYAKGHKYKEMIDHQSLDLINGETP